MGMNKRMLSRGSLLALVASLSIFASSARADSSTFVPEELSAGCPEGDSTPLMNKTPMCNYLAKCCQGNTENSAKCCAGYLKNCND